MVTLEKEPKRKTQKKDVYVALVLSFTKLAFHYTWCTMVAAEYRPLEGDDDIPLNINAPPTIPPSTTAATPQHFIQPTTIYVQDYEQQHATASPFSCVINLANTILGTGMLAMVIENIHCHSSNVY